MTLRSRPVLDRKHRPRWQDELRTQQLTILGFALAIALALGIFGAAAWSGYWEAHFRPVATVAGTSFDRSDLIERERILTAEAVATLTELQAQIGGPRDQFIQQQIDSLSLAFSNLPATAAQSLVDSAVLAARADEIGVTVSNAAVDAEIAERMSQRERVRARLILVESRAEDAGPDDEPTQEQRDEARAAAQAARDRVEDGEDFANVAAEVSDDFTASGGGLIGWFEADDVAYDEYFATLEGAEVGELVGPVETDRGFAILELLDRREASAEGTLRDLLRQEGVSEGAYRTYIRGELLEDAYRDHFIEEVAGSPAAQRRVAQIVIAQPGGEVGPQERARHVLVQPIPDQADQSEATDEQWEEALEEAREVHAELTAPDADWFAIAEERSDDTGSRMRGGDLGWFDPAAGLFVTEFAEALAELEVGEVSEPVRSDFGWHIIQKTGERESAETQLAEVVEAVRADPDAFADTARRVSEDHATAREGGELGWVAAYELDRMHEEAVFALDEVGEISDPVEGATEFTIYRLLETSESREIEDDRLQRIRSTGFERWLNDDVRSTVETWVDPQFASTATT
jgi:parvulin-like peptidyl-prolyl isomerase